MVAAPNGLGLGQFGTAAILNSAQAEVNDFEIGPLERVLEMGVLGGAAYFSVVLGALILSLVTWWRARVVRDEEVQSLGAIAVAVQVAVMVMDLGGDARFNLNGVIYWLSIGLLLSRGVQNRLSHGDSVRTSKYRATLAS